MYVKDYMAAHVITAAQGEILSQCLSLMHRYGVYTVPVVEEGRLVGIVTQDQIRDAAHRVACSSNEGELDLSVSDIRIEEVMETDIVTVSPETSIKEAYAIARAHHVDALPVVVEGNRLVGIAVTNDLLRMDQESDRRELKGTWVHIYQHANKDSAAGGIGEVLSIVEGHGMKVLRRLHLTCRLPGEHHWVIHLDTDNPVEMMRDQLIILDIEGVSALLAELRANGYDVEAKPSMALQEHDVERPDAWRRTGLGTTPAFH
jgi:acetoin utilization protein AcuB